MEHEFGWNSSLCDRFPAASALPLRRFAAPPPPLEGEDRTLALCGRAEKNQAAQTTTID